MSEAAAPGGPAEGADPVALLAAWRTAGLAERQPVRFRLLEAMAARLASRTPAARTVLQARLQQAMAAYLMATDEMPEWPGATSEDAAPGPLAALVAHAQRLSAADGAAALPGTAQAAAPALPATDASPELKALRWFRGTWSRLSADQRLHQSLAQVPDNAGPLNSQQLVHRSLALMRTLSPDYLQHFVAQVDALMWLDQVNSGDIPTGQPAGAAPRKPGRGRRHAVG